MAENFPELIQSLTQTPAPPQQNDEALWSSFVQKQENPDPASDDDLWNKFAQDQETSYRNTALSAASHFVLEMMHPYPTAKELTESQRGIIQGRPLWNTMQAIGQGWTKTEMELAPLSEDSIAALADAKIWDGYIQGEKVTNNAFVDGVALPFVNNTYGLVSRHITLPLLQGINAAKVAMWDAPMGSWEALSEQLGEEVGSEKLGEYLSALPENMFVAIEGAGIHIPHPEMPRRVAQAKANQILESEAEYFGFKEPTPQQAKAINKASDMYPAAEAETAVLPQETVPPQKTVHDVAREIAPDLFTKYDSLHRERDIYRGMIYVLFENKKAEAPTASPFARPIADLQVKMETVNNRTRKIYQERLNDLETQHKEWVQNHVTYDTPEMAEIRQALQKTDYEMRDLAPEVSAVYRDAESKIPPQEVVENIPKTVEEVTAELPKEEQAKVAAGVEQAGKEAKAAPALSIKPIEEQREAILADVKKQLIAAGRSPEEAEAAAQLIAAHYETRAARFEGKRGTAEEMYLRDAPEIRKGRESSPVSAGKTLMQKAKGRIRLATDNAKAAISLMKTADASTFVHETGHHWLDELMRDVQHEHAPQLLKDDAATVRKWLGVEDGAELTTRQHEKFARSFERYMMEGVAPSQALARVFAKFKQWLMTLYQTVDRLKAPITDDIRDVFDRLLSVNPEKVVISAERVKKNPWENIKKDIPAEVKSVMEDTTIADTPTPEAPVQQVGKVEAEVTPPPKGKVPEPAVESPNEPIPVQETQFVDKAGNIRLDNLNKPEDTKQVLRDLAEQNGGFTGVKSGPIPDAQRQIMAEALGLRMDNFNPRKPEGVSNSVWAEAVQKLTFQALDEVTAASKKFSETGDALDWTAYEESRQRLLMISDHFSELTAEAGRTLRVFDKKDKDFLANVVGSLEQQTGKTLLQKQEEARRLSQLDTPAQRAKFLQDSKKAKFHDMLLEFWINALLSGPMTHVKNMLGNVATSLWSVPETAGAAAIGKIRNLAFGSEERVAFGEAQARLFGMVQGARDGIKVAGKAYMDENFATGGRTIDQLRPKAIPSAVVTVLGKEVEVGGKQIRIPGRLLGAEDEFFKAIAYRQELNAIAYRTAFKEKLRGDAFNQRMADLVMNPTEEMMAAAHKHAEYQTYTKNLGATGAALQKFANSHPLLKIVIPFIRTPTNIIKYAGERTPLGVFSREVRANLKGENGEIARDTQIARIAIGTSLALATISLANQKIITGGGPSDPKAKAMLRTTGWQPYALKVGDTYYSYAWLEPFSTILGVSADMSEISAANVTSPEEDAHLGAMLFASVSKNIMSKLSLRGASDLINAVTDPDRYGEAYLQNLAGTAVPSAVAQIARTEDPTMRQARSVTDAFKARIPGMKETLFPVRDVWGEPIVREGSAGPDIVSPIYQSRINNDPVNKALIKIHLYPSKPDRQIRGVDLDDQQYDDYARISGRLMKMRLNNIINQPGFSGVPEEAQRKVITKIIDTSRENARKVVMMKYPTILKQALDNKRRKLTNR